MFLLFFYEDNFFLVLYLDNSHARYVSCGILFRLRSSASVHNNNNNNSNNNRRELWMMMGWETVSHLPQLPKHPSENQRRLNFSTWRMHQKSYTVLQVIKISYNLKRTSFLDHKLIHLILNLKQREKVVY